ncbi:MAG TPA: hypothetical protein VGB09_12575 [Candidatus Binatia bacterium]
MESTFVWILMFAGAAVALLGVFLVASERELKTKRREIDLLLSRLENAAQKPATIDSSEPGANHTEQLAELQARNQNLQNELNLVAGKLELSRRAIDEFESLQQSNIDDMAENHRLIAANNHLSAEVQELRSRLDASAARIHSSAPQSPDTQERSARLEAEIVELRQNLEEIQARNRDLEATRQSLPDIEGIEARHRQERQDLQERIADLERRLLMGQEQLSELPALQERLAEAAGVNDSLRDEIRRYEDELPRWQARIAEGEEDRQRLVALRAPFDELLSKQSALADRQQQLQADLAAFARLMVPMGREPASAGSAAYDRTAQPVPSASFSSAAGNNTPTQAATEEEADKPNKTRRFGVFGMVVLSAAIGAGAFALLTLNSEKQPSAEVVGTSKPSDPGRQSAARPTANPEPKPVVAPARTALPDMARPIEPSAKQNNEPEPYAIPTTKLEPRVAGTFQITQRSRVYAAPSEASRSVGDIEPGMKVNVINARDGWLEIYSKHGRPPGFIRREAAARVTGQN